MTRTPRVERKTEYFPIVGEVKATNDAQGIIEGYLNYIGNIDFGDDRTLKGAFRTTLKDSYARKSAQGLEGLWPYLWNHDYSQIPPGIIFDADETSKGLYTKTQFNMEIQSGRDLYSSFKMGTLKKQSMGYKAIRYEYVQEDKRTIRNLQEVAIVEGSAVVFPMNDLAAVNVVKNSTGKRHFIMPETLKEWQAKDFNATYAESLQDDWLSDLWNIWYALRSEIINAFRMGDQPVEDTRAALDQFSTVMLAYVQQGVDLGMVEALQPDEESSQWGYMSNEDLAREIKAGRVLSAANHATMTKAVQGIQGHCDSLNKMLQSAKPKSLGADDPPQMTKATEVDAVSTQLQGLLDSLSISNLHREITKR